MRARKLWRSTSPTIFIRHTSHAVLSERLKTSLLTRTFPAVYDNLSANPQFLLHTSLSSFLPPPPAHRSPSQTLHPGSHLVYFPPAVPENELLPDGTDTLHAPDPSYKYRLWGGGDVSYPLLRPIELHSDRGIMLKERIVDVKVKGPKATDDPENEHESGRVWVKIQREISFSSPTRAQKEKQPDSNATQGLVVENRWLVFSKSKPSLKLEKITAPPQEPCYEVKLTTTPALLFRFSALTFNAHAIHIDPEYSRKEYGLPGLLVHGPLTFVLMMEVLARALDKHMKKMGKEMERLLVEHVSYKNVMPVFVGEEISICCKRVKHDKAAVREGGQQWEVWVQKMVNGELSLCVKGTAFL